MGLFGKKKPKKKSAFEIQLTPTARDRAAAAREAAKDKAIAVLAREKKKQAARDEMVAKAEEIKERAQARKDAAAAKQAPKKRAAPESQQRCTCHRPKLDRHGNCARCHTKPAGRRR